MLSNAFNTLLMYQSRQMTIERPGGVGPLPVKVSPSNYFRNLAGPEEVVIEGREFVISKEALIQSTFPLPLKRGDRLKDVEIGLCVISEIREIFGFGGSVLGYRIRTS
jgi:hypothetical protein